MDIRRVLVTGSDGMIGRKVVQELNDHGYQVTSVDKYPAQKWGAKTVDCEDLGQVISVMKDHQAVIHLAAIPNPIQYPVEVVFRNNVISTFNVLQAAAFLGIKNIVMASSISALGTAFKFRPFNPLFIPIDEKHPLLSQDSYGLSKMVGELVADGFTRQIPDLALASLRFSLVIDDEWRDRFHRSKRDQEDMDGAFAGVFWAFADARDVAASCRLAMEINKPGHEAFYIAAPTIIAKSPVEELLDRYYPGDYPVAEQIRGRACPVDCGKAGRLLGWKAVYDWEGNPY